VTKSTAALWLPLAALLAGLTGPAQAGVITESFYANGSASVPLPPVFPLGADGVFTALESFASLPLQSPAEGFSTSFGTAGNVVGTYSGAFAIQALGGLPHGGNAIASGISGSLYTLSLTSGPALAGINYFGLDVASLTPAFTLEFLSAGRSVATVTGAELLAATLGTAHDLAQQPGFVAFWDQTGPFDQIRFTGNGGFVSDQHVVGHIATPAAVDSLSISEPGSATLLGLALVGVSAVRFAGKRRV